MQPHATGMMPSAAPADKLILLGYSETGEVLRQCHVDIVATPSRNGIFRTFDVLLEPIVKSSATNGLNGSTNGISCYKTHAETTRTPKIARIAVVSSYDEECTLTAKSLGSASALEFLEQCLLATDTSRRSGIAQPQLTKLVVPLATGYLSRADIVKLRLVDSELVESVTSFAEPLQFLSGDAAVDLDQSQGIFGWLAHLFRKSVAGIHARLEDDWDLQATSASLEAELVEKLSFPWLVKEVHPRRTLAIIEAGRVHPRYGGTGPSVYGAAKALGLNIIAMDNPGHWMQGPEFADWRQEFVPLALHDPPRDDFTDRIVQTVKLCGIQIDGIMTLCESYMNPVARACQQLGLPTQPPIPYLTCTDKFKTSIFEGHQAYTASSADEAISIATSGPDLPYPMIIKPCNGWSSEGVSLVHNKSEIRRAVGNIDTSRHGTKFVMEPYCNGPEVDYNLFLLDGEILFSEVCDDMPKSADENGTTGQQVNTFIELNSVFPSALPRNELDILRASFHASLLRMGFTTGMFHIEGRVQDSNVEYANVDGITDLVPREESFTDTSNTANNTMPKAWLIEINPRPPGMKGTQIIESTWGIDYWALTLLTALRDDERIRALAHPFASGPQYTCVMVFIPAEYDDEIYKGIFDSDDIVDELFQRRPDLKRNVSKAQCLVHRGQQIPSPRHGHNSFLAYFNVYSRRGRREALRLAQEIRREVRFQFK